MASSPPISDVSRPSALPSARIGGPSQSTSQSTQPSSADNLTSSEFLDADEEAWNKKVDAEVEVLVDGMVDIVSLASLTNKDKFRIAQESFQVNCRAEAMVKAANQLLGITHSIKLLLFLSDEGRVVKQREGELKDLGQETEKVKGEVAELLDELLKPITSEEEEQKMDTSG